jgi:aerobic-type carbon monoxide dehydrogenase small subunit (CoxS/CutS family)
MKLPLQLRVNGDSYEELYIDPWKTLQDVLRDDLGLTGVKKGCTTGNCGVCTVLIDGKAVKSCLVLACQAVGKDILTVEGLARGEKLHPLQQAFIDHFAVQCGFCIPGMILTAKALLDENPDATEEDIRHGLHGNLCRCTGYVKIIEAIMAAKHKMSEKGEER